MLIWINFGSFAITDLVYVDYLKNFQIEFVLKSLQAQKGLELAKFLAKFLDINWPNFINRLFTSQVI